MDKNVSPREMVLKILYKVEHEKAYANLALKKYLGNSDYKVVDRGFVTELVYGIMKNKLLIDYTIRQFSNIRMKKISEWILNILRMGVYQIMYLDRIPDSAACNESVKLAKKYGHYASSRFVNGILRNVSRNKNALRMPDRKTDPIGFLSIRFSHPEWMVAYWMNKYGPAFTEALCAANNEVPELVVRVNTLKLTRDELMEYMKAEKGSARIGQYNDEALILEAVGNVEELSAFREGLFQVQDESSMLVSKVLDPCPGDLVIDVCCAPGGKTTHMAQLMQNKGKIIGWDIHAHKIRLVRSAAKRLGIDIIEAEARDAALEAKELQEQADKVLVDAPCSGLGIIRRKPDIKWNKTTGDLEDIVALQKRILSVSSKYVKPGGMLVYSTCTLLDEENMEIIEAFTKENPAFVLQDIGQYFPQSLKKDTLKQGYIQLFPNIDKTDGFFICKMQRLG
ncbi:MAG: 16S rRNA (cytosine(967)-C(5))-methyltransferase RsmB [Firmicutes bacterium]|nr:16S rRNA (cytosine(967)-C(5))-methyltransferase RsmB [Bacillota bacterium]